MAPPQLTKKQIADRLYREKKKNDEEWRQKRQETAKKCRIKKATTISWRDKRAFKGAGKARKAKFIETKAALTLPTVAPLRHTSSSHEHETRMPIPHVKRATVATASSHSCATVASISPAVVEFSVSRVPQISPSQLSNASLAAQKRERSKLVAERDALKRKLQEYEKKVAKLRLRNDALRKTNERLRVSFQKRFINTNYNC
jgi:hypothetical protein